MTDQSGKSNSTGASSPRPERFAFTFDASTEPLIFDPMSQPGSSLTWIGP